MWIIEQNRKIAEFFIISVSLKIILKFWAKKTVLEELSGCKNAFMRKSIIKNLLCFK